MQVCHHWSPDLFYSIVSFHGPPWIHFAHLKLRSYDVNADSIPDPEPAFFSSVMQIRIRLSKIIWIRIWNPASLSGKKRVGNGMNVLVRNIIKLYCKSRRISVDLDPRVCTIKTMINGLAPSHLNYVPVPYLCYRC
jgi:hypothetical protein